MRRTKKERTNKAMKNSIKKIEAQRRCAIYVRSASFEGTAWRGQIELGLAFCAANNYTPLLFGEVGAPGVMLQDVQKMANAGQFECVFVSSMDRFGREMMKTVQTFKQLLRKRIRVYTPQSVSDRNIKIAQVFANSFQEYMRTAHACRSAQGREYAKKRKG